MSPKASPSGLFVGLTTFDLIHYVDRFPAADEKIQANSRWTGAGGPAANAAAAFSALGGAATLLTGLGGGGLSSASRQDLERLGVTVVDLAAEGELPTSAAVVDGSGRRTVVSLNALGFDQDAMAAALPAIAPPDVVSVDSHLPTVVRAVRASLAAETPVVLDPGGYKPHVFELIRDCNHVIASRSLMPELGAEELLGKVAEHGPRLAAVSSGHESVKAEIDGAVIDVPVPAASVRDTVGAGDVLHGAYAYFLADGETIADALGRAAAVATRSCEHLGARVTSDAS